MKKYKLLLVILFSCIVTGAFAQNSNDMRLNEILVHNTGNIIDEYGQREGWIELFNSSYGVVKLGGCFLSNDPNNLQLFQVPKTDIKATIQPKQAIVFYADGDPTKGTFHLNFKLKDSDELFLVLGDGTTIVDHIKLPAQLDTNCSYERLEDGKGTTNGDTACWTIQKNPSPGTTVYRERFETKSQKMARLDPYGWIMALTDMSVVFIALIILYFCFKIMGNISKKKDAQCGYLHSCRKSLGREKRGHIVRDLCRNSIRT
jgi:hypothetical protein